MQKPKITALLLALFMGLAVASLSGQSRSSTGSEERRLEKGVVVKLEQCLNPACDQTDIIAPQDGLELETTLWDKEKKQGIVVVQDRYRAPNRIAFGDLYFDHVAFSPTRKMKSLYAIDRLTLWPKNSKYVRRDKGAVYVVKLPRRPGTVLLGLTGPRANDFHNMRIAGADLKVHGTPGDAKTISGELKRGTPAQALESRILVERSGKTPRALTWTRVKYAGGEGWVNGDESLRPPRVTAVREFLGISISFFGLFAHSADTVRWKNQNYLAFQGIKNGANYAVEFADGLHHFAREKSTKVSGITWKDHYTPVELAVAPAE